MRILLIAPASGDWRGIAHKKLFNGKTFRFSLLSLLTVAAYTPKGHTLELIDEQVEDVPLAGAFDLVGISCMTASAPRAYSLSRAFRDRGIPVVLGGFHPTLNPDEAERHADAIVLGSAARAWPGIIEDLVAGHPLKRRYHGNPDSGKLPPLPRELIFSPKYLTMQSTWATLGCPNRCHFCSIAAFHQGQTHRRPIAEVVGEIASFEKRFFMFVDDNLAQDRDWLKRLCRELAPLRKRWVTQMTLKSAEDPELLRDLRRAGCVGVFVGLESFNESILASTEKSFNMPQHYRRFVDSFHRNGIFVEAGIIFGFDGDTPEVFGRSLKALRQIGIDAIQTSILTPLPGTPLHEEFKDRIIDRDWSHYDYRHVVFQPKGMTAEQLQDGANWVIRSFYSPHSLIGRLLRWLIHPRLALCLAYPLVLNLAYYGRVRHFRIRGRDPHHPARMGARYPGNPVRVAS